MRAFLSQMLDGLALLISQNENKSESVILLTETRLQKDAFWNFLDCILNSTFLFFFSLLPKGKVSVYPQKSGTFFSQLPSFTGGYFWVCCCHSNVLILCGCSDLRRKSTGLGFRSGRTDGWMCTRMRERRCPENWISLTSASGRREAKNNRKAEKRV